MGRGQLDQQLKKAVSVEYWRDLNPQLTVEQPPVGAVADLGDELAPPAIAEQLNRFGVEGYFHTEACFREPWVARIRDGIERVRAEGWHPTFAFVYDELWLVARAPAMRALLHALLGAGYQQRPRVWTYYVEPGSTAPSAGSARGNRGSGWGPHVDAEEPIFAEDGRPKVLSIWIPLTDTDESNGCMYVVPHNLFNGTSIFARFPIPDTMASAEAVSLMHAARSLPARAGSILGWHQNLIHWGSISTSRARGPRISMAMEFQLRDAALTGTTRTPVVWSPEPAMPDLRRRLRSIGYTSTLYLGSSESWNATPERMVLSRTLVSLPLT